MIRRAVPRPTSFTEFAARKTRAAATAQIEHLATIIENRPSGLRGVGNAWTQAHYGGDFALFMPPDGQSAVSLVFVQSSDGNTGGDPAALGGGPTDAHLIYEGLSRVSADAVLAGAATVHGDTFFSVWHPELVALRHELRLPRHPAQIVISGRGRLNLDALLFNVPDIPVFLIAGEESLARLAAGLESRPWIQRIPLVGDDPRPAIDRLREAEGIGRISVVGGRFTATRLVDAGLVQDLYLTTTPREGGEPRTPWYSGAAAPALELITKKQWLDHGRPVVLEHLLLRRRHFMDYRG